MNQHPTFLNQRLRHCEERSNPAPLDCHVRVLPRKDIQQTGGQSLVKCQLSVVKCPRRGFTLVELLVSIGIFTLMTGVVLANYRTYNTNAFFANASEDIVLALRQAQVYGVGVRGNTASCGLATNFDCRYGVSISLAEPSKLITFVDIDDNKKYSSGDTVIETVLWKAPIVINKLECNEGAVCSGSVLNITFRRPNPDATIASVAEGNNAFEAGIITIINGISGVGASTSTVRITKTGQISLK